MAGAQDQIHRLSFERQINREKVTRDEKKVNIRSQRTTKENQYTDPSRIESSKEIPNCGLDRDIQRQIPIIKEISTGDRFHEDGD